MRRVSESEAVEILQAGAALEGLAARHAAMRAGVEEVGALRDALGRMVRLREQGDLLALSNLNASFHRAILEVSAHQPAMRLCRQLCSQIVRYRYRTVLLPGRAASSHAEHAQIVNAIEAHDPPAAETAMRRRISRVADALAEAGAGASPGPFTPASRRTALGRRRG